MSVAILVVAHKPIAGAFRQAALEILKELDDIVFVDLDSDEPQTEQQAQLENAWKSLKAEDRAVIVDIEGATPCNQTRCFCEKKNVLWVTPLSLPLLFKMICYRRLSLVELEKKAREITTMTALMEKKQ